MPLPLISITETKNQSMIGQVAVAQVVMNRVMDDRYPNSVCEVVKQIPLDHLGKTQVKDFQ